MIVCSVQCNIKLIFLSIDSIIIVTASFCNNICTFFILGTSLESLSGLCQEDVAILGKKKKKSDIAPLKPVLRGYDTGVL